MSVFQMSNHIIPSRKLKMTFRALIHPYTSNIKLEMTILTMNPSFILNFYYLYAIFQICLILRWNVHRKDVARSTSVINVVRLSRNQVYYRSIDEFLDIGKYFPAIFAKKYFTGKIILKLIKRNTEMEIVMNVMYVIKYSLMKIVSTHTNETVTYKSEEVLRESLMI